MNLKVKEKTLQMKKKLIGKEAKKKNKKNKPISRSERDWPSKKKSMKEKNEMSDECGALI